MLNRIKSKAYYFLDVIKSKKMIPSVEEIYIDYKDECRVKYYINNHHEMFEMDIFEFKENYLTLLNSDDAIRVKVSKKLYEVYLLISDEDAKKYIWRYIDD